jgi:hypothetical protein
MNGKSAGIFMRSVAALEEAELLCNVVSDTSTGTIFPLHVFAPVLEVSQTISSIAY